MATLMSLCINAQIKIMEPAPKRVMATISHASATSSETPMKALPSLRGSKRIGQYITDEYSDKGGGYSFSQYVSNLPAFVRVATLIPATHYSKLKNVAVKSVRFAMAQDCEVKSVTVYTVKIVDDDYAFTEVATQPFAEGVAKKGWNTVTLSSPVAIPEDSYGILLAYDYKQTADNYPISALGVSGECSTLAYLNGSQGEAFYNFSSIMLSMQANVECDPLPAYDVVLSNFEISNSVFMAGTELEYAFTYENYGSNNLHSLNALLKIDGTTIDTLHINNVSSIPTDYYSKTRLPENISRGNHTVSVELYNVETLPGTFITPTVGLDDDVVSLSFNAYMKEDVMERQFHLIEELTSNSCTYCPRGSEFIETMQELRKNIAVVCIHGNQSTLDPFNTDECEKLNEYFHMEGWPSGVFNRLYFSGEGITPSIVYDARDYRYVAEELLLRMDQYSEPTFATIDIQQELNSDSTEIVITVSGEGGVAAKDLLKDYSLTVYLTEDSLVYRQNDNGNWIRNYVHNNVLRDVVTAVNGDDINWKNNSEYENTFTLKLDEEWIVKNMSIVALISKRQPLKESDVRNMGVSNAYRIFIAERGNGAGGDEPEPIEKVERDMQISTISSTYMLQGEGMSSDGHYIVGMNIGDFHPFVWDREANTIALRKDIGEESNYSSASLDGTAVGQERVNEAIRRAIVTTPDGTTTQLRDNGGAKTSDSYAHDITDDGKTICGWYFMFDNSGSETIYQITPCIWQNLRCKDLPMPSEREAGFPVNGAAARSMTPDGKIIGGYVRDDMSKDPAIIWRLDENGNYQYDFIAKEYFEPDAENPKKPYSSFHLADSRQAISPNGEWVSIGLVPSTSDEPYAARYNLNTKQMEILKGTEFFEPTGIANDGTQLLYTAMGDGILGRVGYVWPAGDDEAICLDDIFAVTKDVPKFAANIPVGFTADSKYIMGFGMTPRPEMKVFTYFFNWEEYKSAVNGIDNVTLSGNSPRNGRIYTIDGKQVRSTSVPGLYIVDGKKLQKK